MINLIQGDCLEKMKSIPDGSIDLILTDPPYGIIKGISDRVEWDNVLNHEKMLSECNRILRFNGCLVLFSQGAYTAKLINDTHGNMPLSYRMIWLKDHFANHLLSKKAPVSYFEDICIFFKIYDTSNLHPLRKYSRELMDYIGLNLKQIEKKLGHRRAEHFFYVESTQFGICTEKTYQELIDVFSIDRFVGFKKYEEIKKINSRFNRRFNRCFNMPENQKYKSNVLEFKKDYSRLHPTQKPIALLEDLIKTYTNEGDSVLDFTMGSGSTGVACKNLNRDFIGIELDKDYFEIAKKRIND